MNSLAGTRPQYDSTTGGSIPKPVRFLIVGLMLAGPGTSSARALPIDEAPRSPGLEIHTSSGASLQKAERPGTTIGKVRRLSGFTWDELARLFGVSRRSLHFWASGRAMSSANEEHLQRVLGVILRIDRGTAHANRAALLSVRDDGVIPRDLLAGGKYEAVVSLLGAGPKTPRVDLQPLSAEARAARTPRPPGELVDALHDRVHREAGRARPAKSVRGRGGA